MLCRRRVLLMPLLALSLSVAACSDSDDGGDVNNLEKIRQVLKTNADIALAAYTDSLETAKLLQTALETFVATPTQANMDAAKKAWLVAREPYGQTEVYRFRASPIDDTNYNLKDGEDGPEGAINAWPLGEALIDYVVAGTDFGPDQTDVTDHKTGVPAGSNIIAETSITIDKALLSKTATAEDERDVVAGYHAIEFLLWGQDLNADGSPDTKGKRDNSAGQRPVTDYALDPTCTSGETVNGGPEICQRRGTYLKVAVAKLIDDLKQVRDGWKEGAEYRKAFTEVADLSRGKKRLLEILTGMGTLSEGELAGERIQIALSADSQEDEHSCFSDNTHRDILLNAKGVLNSYKGSYAGYDSTLDGTPDVTTNKVDGYGIDAYLADIGKTELAKAINDALMATDASVKRIDAAARGGKPVDVLIMNAQSSDAKPLRDTVVSLNTQSTQIAKMAVDLGLGTAADVVDPGATNCDTTNPTKVCPE